MKHFDEWNLLKKHIDESEYRLHYHLGDIWWCKLGQNVGFEQDGKGVDFERPVLILKDFNQFVCLIVPLTTVCKDNKFHFNIGSIKERENFAILSQIRLIDTRRLVNKIGFIESKIIAQIKKSIWNIIR